ncbi:hypothetical protein H6F95_02930 [Cyanobacteria bacterium FACHB-471]|nr:hypothetical protein [Cyanobacteria bacterium FACHB-471]
MAEETISAKNSIHVAISGGLWLTLTIHLSEVASFSSDLKLLIELTISTKFFQAIAFRVWLPLHRRNSRRQEVGGNWYK